jgi:hypothetical protein
MYRMVRWFAAPGILALLLGASAFGQDVVFEGKGGVNRVKMELWALLQQYPPRLGEVLKLDHSLLTNQDYLAAYPDFKTFLQRHPEVIRDPDFFLGERETEIQSLKQRLEQQNFYRGDRSTFRDLLDILAPFTIFFTIVGVLIWAVKIFQDHRRWLRVWRAQAEAHSKLMDRLTNSEDTLAYLQTPAGRRFFEGTPAIDPTPQRFSVPVGRILWSAQAGLLFLLGGISLQFARAMSNLNPDDYNAINILSAIAIGLGVSFILGAAASYMISSRLGLLEQPARRPSSVVEPPASS